MNDPAVLDAFMARVRAGSFGECAVWTGSRLKAGYGIFYFSGAPTKSGGVLAHRMAWTLLYGDPGKRVVCHTCDNPACVNPAHLFLGSHSDNTRDMVRKGRHVGGPLTDAQAEELRALPKRSPLPQWPGFTRDQIRTAAYWIRKGRTYAVHRSR